MKKVNVEKFLADYEQAVQEKENLVASKDEAIAMEKAKIDALEGFSDHVKEVLLVEVTAEKEQEFNFEDADKKIAGFEEYLEDVEEVVEEVPAVEEALVEGANIAEIPVDEFGNPIAQ